MIPTPEISGLTTWKEIAERATNLAERLEALNIEQQAQIAALQQQLTDANSQLTKYEARYETDMHYQRELERKIKEAEEALKEITDEADSKIIYLSFDSVDRAQELQDAVNKSKKALASIRS